MRAMAPPNGCADSKEDPGMADQGSETVMSADCHMDLFYLPPDTFTSRLDARRWGDGAVS